MQRLEPQCRVGVGPADPDDGPAQGGFVGHGYFGDLGKAGKRGDGHYLARHLVLLVTGRGARHQHRVASHSDQVERR